ncbi:MAG: acyl-CoA dehydrogenase [Chloroflexaceae bacterium]|nr:acyl-CoA dehydrogenase [Chloroflexaceae bacterium]NJO04932.1 acyl-CoA dehydrogenase [Chloroflexaceae bacterium]
MLAVAQQTDLYLMDALLTDDERAVRDRVREFCERAVLPVINGYWERAEFPFPLLAPLAELNITGGTIAGYGCPGLSHVAAGLVSMELARGDGSISTLHAVQTGLAMTTLAMLGSEEQKAHWLPAMARLEKLGAFGLTEPEHGSDAVMLETRARRDGNSYVLDGAKRWVGAATFADLIIIWARDDDGNVGGFLVEKGTPGFDAQPITGKIAGRALSQANITLTDVRVPLDHRLPGSQSFKDTARVLTTARTGIAWEALGHALACYEAAVAYVQQRAQFGKTLAHFQTIQVQLAKMLAEITTMQLLSLRLSQLVAQDKLTPAMASLAKMNNAAKARWVAAKARDILGGNGILLEYHVARHFADIEGLYSYEGTDTIQSLIVGREITGVQAFAQRSR